MTAHFRPVDSQIIGMSEHASQTTEDQCACMAAFAAQAQRVMQLSGRGNHGENVLQGATP